MIIKGHRIFTETVTHFNASDGWAMASHVTLSMIMALFPFLIFATSFAGFLGYESQSNAIVELVFDAWPDEVARPIVKEINIVIAERHTSFLSLGIGLAMVFASNGVEAMRVALSRAYRATENRSFIHCRLQSVIFVFCGAALLFLISFLLVFAPYFYSLVARSMPEWAGYESILLILRFVISIGALMFAVFACHAWLPAGPRPVSELWPGILATLILWLTVAGLFTVYLRGFADYSATYAGLAGIMTALIFLYLMAAILLLGGELNAALLKDRKLAPVDPRVRISSHRNTLS
jgi:membrane protein